MNHVFPDVNLLLALFVRGHKHQPAARSWYREAGSPVLVLCRVSQIGFLRLLTTASMMQGDVLTNDKAWALYDDLSQNDIFVLRDEPADVASAFRERSTRRTSSPKVWSDAYFSSFAQQAKLRRVTFDAALSLATPRSILLK